MTRHCMIDIETLGTTDDAVILSIGIVMFDANRIIRKCYLPMDVRHQMDEGRIIDPGTLAWWGEQVTQIPSNGTCMREEFNPNLMETRECVTFWERGNFDLRIISHYMKGRVPWKFYQVRDHRTVFPKMPKQNTHSAIEDAVAQVECLLDSCYDLEEGVDYNA